MRLKPQDDSLKLASQRASQGASSSEELSTHAPSALSQQTQAGYVSLVGTPIGNLSDMSPRAVSVLKHADVLLCEDTRVTSKLLNHFDIHTKLIRADENVLPEKIPAILTRLAAGEHIALVSDAGMPGVSDPGQVLADAALNANYRVEVIPGPSAVLSALAASGFAMSNFYFEGFLPRKTSALRKRLHVLARIPATLVIYESPHRVLQTLQELAGEFAHTRCALVRELTKIHEDCMRDTIEELIVRVQAAEQVRPLRGECVLVVECTPDRARECLDNLERMDTHVARTLEDAIAEGLQHHISPSALAKQLAHEFDISKSSVYNKIIAISM